MSNRIEGLSSKAFEMLLSDRGISRGIAQRAERSTRAAAESFPIIRRLAATGIRDNPPDHNLNIIELYSKAPFSGYFLSLLFVPKCESDRPFHMSDRILFLPRMEWRPRVV